MLVPPGLERLDERLVGGRHAVVTANNIREGAAIGSFRGEVEVGGRYWPWLKAAFAKLGRRSRRGKFEFPGRN